MKILIVDDSFNNIEILSNMLKSYGDIITVSDGFQAITEFQRAVKTNSLFDLICLDIEMTYLDGISTLFAIREIEKQENIRKSVVFMITASSDISDILDSFEGKANAFIVKDSNSLNRIKDELKNNNLI